MIKTYLSVRNTLLTLVLGSIISVVGVAAVYAAVSTPGSARASVSGAMSVLYQDMYQGVICATLNKNDPKPRGARVLGACSGGGGASRVWNVSTSVSYHARVVDTATGLPITCGSSVNAGTPISLQFVPHSYLDIFWFATGNYADSPYGYWVDNAYAPAGGICNAQDLLRNTSEVGPVYAALSVAPPAKSIIGTSQLGCSAAGGNNMSCTTPHSGTFTPTFTFAPTYGHMYFDIKSGYGMEKSIPRCSALSAYMHEGSVRPFGKDDPLADEYTFNVPTQSISCPITVVGDIDDEPDPDTPTAPTVWASGGACTTRAPYSISMSATSPGNLAVRYLIDWNADGITDEIAPPTGYVPSGTTMTASRRYVSGGTQTVRVAAEAQAADGRRLVSAWAVHSFTCTGNEDVSNGFWWDVGPWRSCVLGTSTRTVRCRNDAGAVVADTNCPAPKPAVTANCTDGGTGPLGAIDLPIRVVPSLVRSGDKTRVYWGPVLGMHACAVRADINGDAWPVSTDDLGLESPVGGEASSPITDETTYTLRCVDEAGTEYSNKASVRILPNWQEF